MVHHLMVAAAEASNRRQSIACITTNNRLQMVMLPVHGCSWKLPGTNRSSALCNGSQIVILHIGSRQLPFALSQRLNMCIYTMQRACVIMGPIGQHLAGDLSARDLHANHQPGGGGGGGWGCQACAAAELSSKAFGTVCSYEVLILIT